MLERIKLFIPLLVFALLATIFLQLEKGLQSGSYDPSLLPSPLVGHQLPEFTLSLLGQPQQQRSSSALQGEPSLLNVWASWCFACRIEHDFLNQLSQRGIPLYGLNYKDRREDASDWLAALGDPYRFNFFDHSGEAGLLLGVYGAPETYVIDSKGVVRYRHVGILSEEVWQEKIIPLGLWHE